MRLSDDVRDITITMLAAWLLASTAVMQEPTPRPAPVRTATVREVRAHDLIVGSDLISTATADADPVGRVADLVVDLTNASLPFAVVAVEGGPRTAIPWHELSWNRTDHRVAIAAALAELQNRAALEPELAELERSCPPAVHGDTPRLALASELAGAPVRATADVAFGRLAALFVDPRRAEIRFASIAVATADADAPVRHVVPWSVVTPVRDPRGALAFRIDRSVDRLRATPQLAPDRPGLADPTFRATVYRALDVTPPREDRGDDAMVDAADASRGRDRR